MSCSLHIYKTGRFKMQEGINVNGQGKRRTLKEKSEKILEMYEAGYTYKEICEALRVAPKTIAKVLREGKLKDSYEVIDSRLRDFELKC